MITASLAQLKKTLKNLSEPEKDQLILALAKFKKDNKELLSYLLFESADEDNYIQETKQEMDALFEEINHSNSYYVRKGCRKILRLLKKNIKYSNEKSTEVQLLLYYIKKVKNEVNIGSSQLDKIIDTQIRMAERSIASLHPDLQYDYNKELAEIT